MLSTIALLAMTVTPQSGFDPGRLAAIPPKMKEFIDAGKNAGIVTLVSRHGRTVFFDAQGLANVEKRAPMTKDTIFQIMSMTKPIVALLVVRCAEEGLLNLDDRIEKYLPGFASVKIKMQDGSLVEPRTKPTIRHLLTHTSGMYGMDPGGLTDDQKALITLERYGELLPTSPIYANPGDEINYSGPGFSTLGRIIEIASKMKLEEFARTRLFEPLKLHDTFFFAPREKHSRIAYMYSTEGPRLVKFQENPYRTGAVFTNAAGGLYSTAADMARLMTCVVEGGKLDGYRLLSPAAVEAMTTLHTGNLKMDASDEQGYGLGFAVTKKVTGTLKPAGAFGHTGAFGTEFWADRKRGIVAVFMTQSFESDARKTFNTLVNAAFVGP